MKSAIHYGLTASQDEVWLMLDMSDFCRLARWLEHGRVLPLADRPARAPNGVFVIMTRTEVRLAARFIDTVSRQTRGSAPEVELLARLARRLRYDAEWLDRAETEPSATRVAEARAGAGA